MSRAVFNENNKVYTLKNDIDFDFQNLTPFEALAQSLSTFNLKVTEDASKNVSFVFSSTSKNGYKTEITFTDLNKVNGNDLFDPASLTEAPVTGFKESLFAAPADFETTISYLGEISDKFNVPDELYEDGAWMVLKESIGTDTTLNYLDLVYAGASYDSATFDDLYVNYLTKMMDLGWTLNEEEECLVLEDYKLKALNQVDAGDNYFVIELSKPKA